MRLCRERIPTVMHEEPKKLAFEVLRDFYERKE